MTSKQIIQETWELIQEYDDIIRLHVVEYVKRNNFTNDFIGEVLDLHSQESYKEFIRSEASASKRAEKIAGGYAQAILDVASKKRWGEFYKDIRTFNRSICEVVVLDIKEPDLILDRINTDE